MKKNLIPVLMLVLGLLGTMSCLSFAGDAGTTTYTIKYDANVPNNASTVISGVINMADYSINNSRTTISSVTNIDYDADIKISTEGFMLSGYAFAGWNTKANGSGTHYNSNQSVKSLTSVDKGVVTLYAEWKPLEYQLEFNKGEGIGETVSGEMANEIMQFDTSKALTPLAYTNNTRSAFVAWRRTGGSGTFLYLDKAVVENLCSASYLDDLWKDAYQKAGNSTFPTYETTKSNYIKLAIPISALWTNKSDFTAVVTLDWEPQASQSVSLIKSDNDTVTYTGSSNAYGMVEINDVPNGTYKVYVNDVDTGKTWTTGTKEVLYLPYFTYSVEKGDNVSQVSAQLDTGAVASPFSDEKATLEGETIKLTAECGNGYLVDNWRSTLVDPTYVNGSATDLSTVKIKINGPTKMKAETRPSDYAVSFDSNGGSGVMGTLECLFDKQYNLPANEFTRDGYVFIGWNTMANGNGDAYDDKAQIMNLTNQSHSTVQLFAQWKKKIDVCTVSTIEDQTYTGSEIKPEPVVTFKIGSDNITLIRGTDYTLSYTNNKDAGTASVTITGKNACTGSLTKEFKIVKIKVAVPTAVKSLTYNGSVQTGVKLPADAPYTLTGNTATNAGYYTATATLKDKVNYEWNLATPTTSDQKINWYIQSCTINVKADNKTTNLYEKLDALTYTADALCGNDKFTGELATDADKAKAGTYKITQGTLSAGSNYYINFTDGTYTVADPEPGTRFFVRGKAYKKSIKYTWSAVPNAAKYKVYFAKCGSKKYKRVTTTTAITYTKKKLAGKTAYKAYVEAYDAEGKLIAKAPVVVLATTGSSKANATAVTADVELSVALGESVKVSAKVSAKDSKKALRWKGHFSKAIRYYSSDSSIATVDKSGKVTGVARGVVNIYSVAPSGVSAVTKVRVLK